jgi:hypothetical protein
LVPEQALDRGLGGLVIGEGEDPVLAKPLGEKRPLDGLGVVDGVAEPGDAGVLVAVDPDEDGPRLAVECWRAAPGVRDPPIARQLSSPGW